MKTKKMLEKIVLMFRDNEKKFDLNLKRMKDLNTLLFEYESLSSDTYSQSEYLGTNPLNASQKHNC